MRDMNKKIGVCCEYKQKNYGSMLQALATVLQLEKLGYDYEIIDYSRKLTPDLLIRSLRRIPEEIPGMVRRFGEKQKRKKYPELEKAIGQRNLCFQDFSARHFTKKSQKIDTFAQLRKAAEEYSAVLVGSDQLWLPKGYSTGFFNLLFVPDHIPRIAYATSFGVSGIPASREKIARKFLNRIDYISVRELQAAAIVKDLTGREVKTVVDPTLLFQGREWETIVPERQMKQLQGKKYIFCYFLGNNPEHRIEAEKLSNATGCEIVFIPHLDEFIASDMNFGDVQLFQIGPEEFINLIRNAEYVCTDSFHGSVFSILNHKQFVTFSRYAGKDRNSRNSRIDSLLYQTGLEERRFRGNILEQMKRTIDYDEAERRIQEARAESLDYLTDALQKCCGT